MSSSEILKHIQGDEFRFRQYYLGDLVRLGITEDELKGKRVLDIGAGFGRFGYFLRQRKVNCTLIELDRNYSDGVVEGANAVWGDALWLPFKDESFDMVISIGSMPILVSRYAKAYGRETVKKVTKAVLTEAVNVTKQGGEVRMCPIPRSNDISYNVLLPHEIEGFYAVADTVDAYVENLNSTSNFNAKVENKTLVIYKK